MQETQETRVCSLGQEDSLEEEMATHSSILAWKIPWSEGPRGLQSMWPQRVRHRRLTEHSFIHSWASLLAGLLAFLRAGLCLMSFFIFSTRNYASHKQFFKSGKQAIVSAPWRNGSSILSIISNSGPMASPAQLSLSKPWELVKDREARLATVHGVAKSQTRLSD